jgi:hypothetical protein
MPQAVFGPKTCKLQVASCKWMPGAMQPELHQGALAWVKTCTSATSTPTESRWYGGPTPHAADYAPTLELYRHWGLSDNISLDPATCKWYGGCLACNASLFNMLVHGLYQYVGVWAVPFLPLVDFYSTFCGGTPAADDASITCASLNMRLCHIYQCPWWWEGGGGSTARTGSAS